MCLISQNCSTEALYNNIVTNIYATGSLFSPHNFHIWVDLHKSTRHKEEIVDAVPNFLSIFERKFLRAHHVASHLLILCVCIYLLLRFSPPRQYSGRTQAREFREKSDVWPFMWNLNFPVWISTEIYVFVLGPETDTTLNKKQNIFYYITLQTYT